MTLAIYFILLLTLAGWSCWTAADRLRDYFMVAFLAVALLPALATTVTGDVSRYLPSASFSAGIQGKDEIIIASALTTVLVAIILAAALMRVIKLGWRRIRATGGHYRPDAAGEE